MDTLWHQFQDNPVVGRVRCIEVKRDILFVCLVFLPRRGVLITLLRHRVVIASIVSTSR